MAVDDTTQSMKQSLQRHMGYPSTTKTSHVSVMPQSESRVAHFDFLFSTILNNFLDGATRQIQGGSQAMSEEMASIDTNIIQDGSQALSEEMASIDTNIIQDGSQALSEEMASICANIACSPADRCALIQVALKSIPFSVKEAFGQLPWSWQLVGNIKEATQTNLDSATGVYAYHLTNINEQDKQNFYVGQTTRSFASRWVEHARRREATERPKKFSSKFYQNLKMTRPKDISIFILADISNFQEDVVVHKVMARILEAGFCVFFDSMRQKDSPRYHILRRASNESISFARRWSVISLLAIFSSHCSYIFPSRPSCMPAVPWPGMNFEFPLFQDILLIP